VTARIRGGYYIKARIIKDKPIQRMPPCVRETFDYLLREANHKDAQYSKHNVKRGQLFRSYKQIRQDLCWNIGYRQVMYSENAVKKAMKALRDKNMVETTKALGGVLITIVNYDFYQDSKNYESTKVSHESTSVTTAEGTCDGTYESTSEGTCDNQYEQEIEGDLKSNENSAIAPTKRPTKNHDRSHNNKNVKNANKKKRTDGSIHIEAIIDYFNQICGTKYTYRNKKTNGLITSRIEDGFDVGDFKTVIFKKFTQWKDDERMKQYINPMTLFSADNFEKYLNQLECSVNEQDNGMEKAQKIIKETRQLIDGNE
jgi:uncharacterized phage protein (TIGR02220 family)